MLMSTCCTLYIDAPLKHGTYARSQQTRYGFTAFGPTTRLEISTNCTHQIKKIDSYHHDTRHLAGLIRSNHDLVTRAKTQRDQKVKECIVSAGAATAPTAT